MSQCFVKPPNRPVQVSIASSMAIHTFTVALDRTGETAMALWLTATPLCLLRCSTASSLFRSGLVFAHTSCFVLLHYCSYQQKVILSLSCPILSLGSLQAALYCTFLRTYGSAQTEPSAALSSSQLLSLAIDPVASSLVWLLCFSSVGLNNDTYSSRHESRTGR